MNQKKVDGVERHLEKHRLGTTPEEEVLLLISFLREEETRTDGAIITILKNSLLSQVS